LKASLIGESAEGGYRELGRELGLSAGAVKVRVHRLRRRYRDILRDEIAETVLSEEAIKEEIQHLFRALSTP
jgi:RNA polymerase sigma-70 factor (ECF subfamily)